MKNKKDYFRNKSNEDKSGYKIEELEIASSNFLFRPNKYNNYKYNGHD
jgi:hypothetical protein